MSEVIEPGELIEPEEIEVSPLAVEAAKAELALEAAESVSDVRSRTLRTLLQGAVAVAVLAALTAISDALSEGNTDYRAIGLLVGQAVFTAVVTYFHNKAKPQG